jgi:SAM-dependent methyltransferase
VKAPERAGQGMDPVAAYDLLSSQFPAIAQRRKRYLDAVDDLIVARAPSASRSLLDVGAGDGSRAHKIASRAGIATVVLLEPSQGMNPRAVGSAEIWRIRAEDLRVCEQTPRFDAITCLWNVLGHIRPAAARAQVLRQLRQLLNPAGKLFVDVNHRYNVRAYGGAKSVLRFVNDRVLPREENGDVLAHWSVGGVDCSTYGHLFTHREMSGLAANTNWKVEECIPVDYETGERTRFLFQGSLLYLLKP